MTRITIPQHPDEISPEWLTHLFHRNQIIPGDVEVLSIDRSDPGRKASYAGFVSRLKISYSSENAPGPETMIAKFPAPELTIRRLFRLLYRNEAMFYRHLADETPIRVPTCYASLINRKRTRSLLLLEDLSPFASLPTHTDGCSTEQARIALVRLAQFHARWWQDPEISNEHSWLGRYQVNSTQNWMIYAAAWLPFQYRVRHITPEPTLQLFRSLWRYRDNLLKLDANRPQTIHHGDFRLANLAFTPDDAVVFDWQVVRIGPPMFDVAYFMFTSLSIEQRRSAEQDLLSAYHATLLENGVTYSMDELMQDYRTGLLMTIPQSMVIGAFLRLDEEREVEIQQMLEQFDALREDHELEKFAGASLRNLAE